MSLDMTLEGNEETRFRNKHARFMRQILKKTHFNATELECILLIYFKLQRENGDKYQYITRNQFRSIFYYCFNMPEDIMMERIFVALDKGTTPYVTIDTWVLSMSLFLRGTLDEKITYCFAVYDILGDGLIRRDNMITLLRRSVIKQQEEDVEEAVKDFVDLLLRRIDIDHDGAISFADYRQSILETPALLECLGNCLPDRESVYSFLTTFTDKISKYWTALNT